MAEKAEKVIAPHPPRDGREWEAQCARCGSSTQWLDCDNCGGDGWIEDDDWQADEGDGWNCDWCDGYCGHMACVSTTGWCEKHPIEGREDVPRGTIEWFTFDVTNAEAAAPHDGEPR